MRTFEVLEFSLDSLREQFLTLGLRAPSMSLYWSPVSKQVCDHGGSGIAAELCEWPELTTPSGQSAVRGRHMSLSVVRDKPGFKLLLLRNQRASKRFSTRGQHAAYIGSGDQGLVDQCYL